MNYIAVLNGGNSYLSHLPTLIALDLRATLYLTMGILALYLLNSFVYFGEQDFWKNVDASGKRLLVPLKQIPTVLGKLDLAPFLAMAIAYGLSFALRHKQLAAWLS